MSCTSVARRMSGNDVGGNEHGIRWAMDKVVSDWEERLEQAKYP